MNLQRKLQYAFSLRSLIKLIADMNAEAKKAGQPLWLDPKAGDRPITPHGTARATFRTWVSEKTNVQGEIAEFALSHVPPDKVEQAYQRSTMVSKRFDLMNAWGNFCNGRDNVTRFRRRKTA